MCVCVCVPAIAFLSDSSLFLRSPHTYFSSSVPPPLSSSGIAPSAASSPPASSSLFPFAPVRVSLAPALLPRVSSSLPRPQASSACRWRLDVNGAAVVVPFV